MKCDGCGCKVGAIKSVEVALKLDRRRISKLIRAWHTKYKKGNHWTNALVSELQNKIEEI